MRKILSVLLLLVTVTAFAADHYTLTGGTYSKAMGKEETRDGLILNVTGNKDRSDVHLEGYEMLGYKNISIKAYLITSPDGTIVDFGDVTIKGVAGARIKTVKGFLTKSAADITLDGKVAGVFGFHIRYRAGK